MCSVTCTTAQNQHSCLWFSYIQITSGGSRFPLLHHCSRKSSDFVYFLENVVTFIVFIAYFKRKSLNFCCFSRFSQQRMTSNRRISAPSLPPDSLSLSLDTKGENIWVVWRPHREDRSMCAESMVVQRLLCLHLGCVYRPPARLFRFITR